MRDRSQFDAHVAAGNEAWISLTGLRLKKPWFLFRFFLHAIPSFRQAQRAEGNLYVEVASKDGVQHTLSAWTSREAMLNYIKAGSHQRAMKAFPQIATGRIYGYASRELPTWEDIPKILEAKGRLY